MRTMQWIDGAKCTLIVSKIMFFFVTFFSILAMGIKEKVLLQTDNFVVEVISKSLITTLLILGSIYLIFTCNIVFNTKNVGITLLLLGSICLIPSDELLKYVLIAYISYGLCTAIGLLICAYNMPQSDRAKFSKLFGKVYFSWYLFPHID